MIFKISQNFQTTPLAASPLSKIFRTPFWTISFQKGHFEEFSPNFRTPLITPPPHIVNDRSLLKLHFGSIYEISIIKDVPISWNWLMILI